MCFCTYRKEVQTPSDLLPCSCLSPPLSHPQQYIHPGQHLSLLCIAQTSFSILQSLENLQVDLKQPSNQTKHLPQTHPHPSEITPHCTQWLPASLPRKHFIWAQILGLLDCQRDPWQNCLFQPANNAFSNRQNWCGVRSQGSGVLWEQCSPTCVHCRKIRKPVFSCQL